MVAHASARDVRRVPLLFRISQRRQEESQCWQDTRRFCWFLSGRTRGPAWGWPDVRARCAPRPTPATHFAASTRRKSMLTRRKTMTLYCFLTGRTRGPASGWPDIRARGAPRPIPATLFAASTTRKTMLRRKNVDFVLFLMGRTRPPAYGYPGDVHSVLFLLHFSQRRRQASQC